MFADLSNIKRTRTLVLSRRCRGGVRTCGSWNSLFALGVGSLRRCREASLVAKDGNFCRRKSLINSCYADFVCCLSAPASFSIKWPILFGKINARNRQKSGRKIALRRFVCSPVEQSWTRIRLCSDSSVNLAFCDLFMQHLLIVKRKIEGTQQQGLPY